MRRITAEEAFRQMLADERSGVTATVSWSDIEWLESKLEQAVMSAP